MLKPVYKRVFLIVMDSVGIGEAPDAGIYQDKGADTLGNIANYMDGNLKLPNLVKLGLGNIKEMAGIEKTREPMAHYGKMMEVSNGKDTLTGHWEIMGLHIKNPFRTFPSGFPDELINELEHKTGRKVIGNKSSSGTTILDELGEEHCQTGNIIVYTSADSVLQIAAHEEIIPLEELYEICKIAREITLKEEYMVGRVIARPFVGKNGQWVRTANRHDYALKPFGRTVMNALTDHGFTSIALGKIHDIYDGEGITRSIRTISNMDGMDKLLENMNTHFTGLCFLNLVDFDAKYGHRRDPKGYAIALEEFDARLPEVINNLQNEDLLIITADHGNDPTHHGSDHTREFVPLLAYHKQIMTGRSLGIRNTFSDVGATIAECFQIPSPNKNGTSFLRELM